MWLSLRMFEGKSPWNSSCREWMSRSWDDQLMRQSEKVALFLMKAFRLYVSCANRPLHCSLVLSSFVSTASTISLPFCTWELPLECLSFHKTLELLRSGPRLCLSHLTAVCSTVTVFSLMLLQSATNWDSEHMAWWSNSLNSYLIEVELHTDREKKMWVHIRWLGVNNVIGCPCVWLDVRRCDIQCESGQKGWAGTKGDELFPFCLLWDEQF